MDVPNYGIVTYPRGSTRAYAYDELMRVAGITSKDPGQNIMMDYSYTYDNSDNIVMKQTEHGAYNYTYDELYRLTSATNPNRPAEGFSYDPVGNRLTSSDTAGNWAYNGNNELRNYPAVTFDYDSNGNTVRKTEGATVTDYSWDAENRLMNVECHGEGGAPCHSEHGSGGILYSYDPFGRRLSKTVGDKTIYYFYSDEGLAGEFNASGQVLKTYGFASNSTWTTDPVFMKQGNSYYFYHNDHLGTPQKMTAVNGAVVWSAKYEAFGKATVDAGSTIENNLRFPGQYYDQETGEQYNFHRYYEQSASRYISRDPLFIVPLLIGKFSENEYFYAKANPIIYSDSLGLFYCPEPLRVCQKKGFNPVVNGCGPQSGMAKKLIDATGINLNNIALDFDFSEACNEHDKCYQRCESGRFGCDWNFRKNIIKICDKFHFPSRGGEIPKYEFCLRLADIYFFAVFRFGSGMYKDGQNASCDCCHPCNME